jgi:hypothetical protein
MKYNFPQFKVTIVDPTIEVNLNTIGDKAVDKLLSVDVVLTTDTATFGVRAEDMPYIDTWEDAEVPALVDEWLKQFEDGNND